MTAPLVRVTVEDRSRPPIEIDRTLPRFQATWAAFAAEYLSRAATWSETGVPLNRYGGDDGYSWDRPKAEWVENRLAECKGILDRVCRVSGENLRGWRFKFWRLDELLVTRELVLVAIDPNGATHDISALAAGIMKAIETDRGMVVFGVSEHDR